MRSENFIKSYIADAAILPFRIVKAGAADGSIAQAAAATDASMGVADSLGAGAAGDSVDVIVSGYASVTYGGTVTRGAPLTADASGRAIVATAEGSRLIGFAVVAGVVGDVGTVDLAKSVFAVAGSA